MLNVCCWKNNTKSLQSETVDWKGKTKAIRTVNEDSQL